MIEVRRGGLKCPYKKFRSGQSDFFKYLLSVRVGACLVSYKTQSHYEETETWVLFW